MENDRTETEAGQSMCVFARRLLTVAIDQRVEGVIGPVARVNQPVPGAFNQWAENDQMSYASCLGSRCMGWLWTDALDRGVVRRGRCGYRSAEDGSLDAFPVTRQ